MNIRVILILIGLTSLIQAEESKSIVDDRLIKAIIIAESDGDRFAVSPDGARGLMQIMPDTWDDECVKLLGHKISFDLAFNPKINCDIGSSHLQTISDYLDKHESSWKGKEDRLTLLIAAYNCGRWGIRKRDFIFSNFPLDTQLFVEKVMEEYRRI